MNRAELCGLLGSMSWWLSACSGRSIQLEGEARLGFNACEVDSYRCSDADYQRCSSTPEGPVWVTIESCRSPASCGPIGGCLEQACEAAEVVCVGPILRSCNADLTGFEELNVCPTAAHCDPVGGCRAMACEAGELRCNGNLLEECRQDRLDWEILQVCAARERCDPVRPRCVEPNPVSPGACELGASRCVRARLELCGVVGWALLETCASQELCDASPDSRLAGCRTPACTGGDLRCSGPTTLEWCGSARTGFELLWECALGSVCDVNVMGGCRAPG